MSGKVTRYSDDGLTLENVAPCSEFTVKKTATSIKGVGIATYAFFDAKDTITTVKFEPNSCMKTISPYCFYNCIKLSLVDFSTCPDLTEIGDYAFRYCSSLKTLTLPDTITSVGSYAFANSGLISMSFPASVQKIGKYSLFTCTSLVEVNIHPNCSVTEFIDHQLTSTKITSLFIPKSITSLSGYNFECLYYLETITVDPLNSAYLSKDNIIFTKEAEKTILFVAPAKRGEYTIPEDVTVIGDCAFHSSSITKVNFPSKLEIIRGWAFVGSKISELNLPQNCTELGKSAFKGCNNLVSIVFTNGLEKIGTSCFESCDNLKSVTLPESIKSLGGSAFPPGLTLKFDEKADLMVDSNNLIINKGATRLCQCASDEKIINLPDSIQIIGDSSFKNIKTIQQLVISQESNLATIEASAFYESSLSSITFTDNIMVIMDSAFYGCQLKTLHIGRSFVKIGASAFNKCQQLTTITSVSGSPLHLSHSAFLSCTELSNVDFNGRVVDIGERCFEGCTKLSSLAFSKEIASIGKYAFKNSGLTSCTFPPNASIASFEIQLFYNCSGLVNITIPEGVLSIMDEALAYTGIGEIVLPKSVVNLSEKCFQQCKNVKKLVIQEQSNLTNIGFGSFYGCSSFKTIENHCDNFDIENYGLFNKALTELIILPPDSECKFFSFPTSLEKIKISALQGCKNLQVIFLPYSVTEIMPYAFSGCTDLRSINIPHTCAKIGEFAFEGCKKLQCGLAIENTNSDFITNLVEVARMPRSATKDCDRCTAVSNNRSIYNFSLMFAITLFISC